MSEGGFWNNYDNYPIGPEARLPGTACCLHVRFFSVTSAWPYDPRGMAWVRAKGVSAFPKKYAFDNGNNGLQNAGDMLQPE